VDKGAKRPEVRAIQTKRSYMRRVDGAKVTGLTLGELRPCREAGAVVRRRTGMQQSAYAKVVAAHPQ
jgi:hypothetical protein